jgi:ketosteroid isomerase-like protein
MKRLVVVSAVLMTLCCLVAANPEVNVTQEILTLERQTMEGWLKGNPDPTLAILDPEVTYFHAPLEKRLEGFAAVQTFFEPYRGRPLFDSYEIAEPKVQTSGDIAILTYQLITQNGTATGRWNSTEVYQHKMEGWRIIHAHWSQVKMQ